MFALLPSFLRNQVTSLAKPPRGVLPNFAVYSACRPATSLALDFADAADSTKKFGAPRFRLRVTTMPLGGALAAILPDLSWMSETCVLCSDEEEEELDGIGERNGEEGEEDDEADEESSGTLDAFSKAGIAAKSAPLASFFPVSSSSEMRLYLSGAT